MELNDPKFYNDFSSLWVSCPMLIRWCCNTCFLLYTVCPVVFQLVLQVSTSPSPINKPTTPLDYEPVSAHDHKRVSGPSGVQQKAFHIVLYISKHIMAKIGFQVLANSVRGRFHGLVASRNDTLHS